MFVSILTPRFMLRPLRVDDVTETYSKWFDDPDVAPYILAARKSHDVASLRRYVEERSGRSDVLFLGIFVLDGSLHIGNVKYEPINEHDGYAVMGILVGDRTWRGQGVAGEVIMASAQWLQTYRGIHEIRLWVNKEHRAAIAAYKKIGFRTEPPTIALVNQNSHGMVWRLDPPEERIPS